MVKTVQNVQGGLADPPAAEEVSEHMVVEQQHVLTAIQGRNRFKAAFGGPYSPARDDMDVRVQIQAVAATLRRDDDARDRGWIRGNLLEHLSQRLPGTRSRHDQHAVIIGLYADAVDMLRRYGLERRRGQTPVEFARNLPREPFGDALAALTVIYNRIRFGQMAHEGDLAQARELLHSL